MPQHVHFQNGFELLPSHRQGHQQQGCFQLYENGPPDSIPKGIYLHSNYTLDRVEKRAMHLDHHYPIRLGKNRYLKQSTTQTKGYFNRLQRSLNTASAETNLHNEPSDGRPNSMQKIARVENAHKCLACLPIHECLDIDGKRSLTHFKRTQRSHARVHPNGHAVASEEESLSQKSVASFKPRGYQIKPARMPMTTGDFIHLTFSGIQFNANQLEPKYPIEIQNQRLQHTLGKPKHQPHPIWPNFGPDLFPDPFRCHSEVSTNLMRENQQQAANAAKCKPFSVIASNAIQPTSPLSHVVMPSAHHSSAESDYYRLRHTTTDSSSTSTFRAVNDCISPDGIHSAKPAASRYYPQDINPLSRGENEREPTSSKCHACCESRKQTTATLPDHRHVPPNASSVAAPRLCRAADLNGQSCSANASQSLKTSGKVQYTAGYAPSQVNATEGLLEAPIQYSYQSTFEGRLCRPTRTETVAPNHRFDSMSPALQEKPPCSKSIAMIAARPCDPDYVAQPFCQPASSHGLLTSNLRYRSMDGYFHTESNNLSRSAYSGFQEQRNSRRGPCSNVNACIAPKQQPLNENNADDLKYGGPSSWSGVSRYASPNIARGYPSILPRHPRVCDSLTTTKEPHCYVSVDSKPRDERKKEEFKFCKAAKRCREMVQPREDRIQGIDQEQRAKKLEKFTKFVVGVETQIHWDKIRNTSSRSEGHDMEIVSVSSTHSPRDDPTETHSNYSQSESDDAFCMARLERVYYSISAKPPLHAQSSVISREQTSEHSEFDADSHEGNLTKPHGDTHQILANCEYSFEQSSSVAARNKTCKGLSLIMKGHKTSHVSVSRSVKRKANTSITKSDEVCNAKRTKMEKKNTKASFKGTVTPAVEKVKKSIEILPTK